MDEYVKYHAKFARTESPSTGQYSTRQLSGIFIPGLGMQRPADAECVRGRDSFDEERATHDAFLHFPRFWENWLELATWKRLSESETTGIDWRTADGTKDDCIWATVPSTTQPSQYDFGVLLAICPITVYEAIIKSGVAEKQIWALTAACPFDLGQPHLERGLRELPLKCTERHVGPADKHGRGHTSEDSRTA